MGAAAAGPVSLAAMGFNMGSSLLRGVGEMQGDQYQAARLKRAAEYGRVKAAQTSAQLTEQLNQTLGNIDVVRAAARTDPTSPTGAAYRDFEEALGERRRGIAVGNINAQVLQDEADASYMRRAGTYALLGGALGAGGDLTKALGPSKPLFGFGSQGSG
jgi:hypothetical protein